MFGSMPLVRVVSCVMTGVSMWSMLGVSMWSMCVLLFRHVGLYMLLLVSLLVMRFGGVFFLQLNERRTTKYRNGIHSTAFLHHVFHQQFLHRCHMEATNLSSNCRSWAVGCWHTIFSTAAALVGAAVKHWSR